MEKKSIRNIIGSLEKADPKARNSGLAQRMLKLASLPRRRRVTVNLSKLNSLAKPGENIIVPGKILATGSVDKAFNVAAIEWSGASAKKLKDAGCKVLGIEEMLKKENARLIV